MPSELGTGPEVRQPALPAQQLVQLYLRYHYQSVGRITTHEADAH
jgi:hypothetical protein